MLSICRQRCAGSNPIKPLYLPSSSFFSLGNLSKQTILLNAEKSQRRLIGLQSTSSWHLHFSTVSAIGCGFRELSSTTTTVTTTSRKFSSDASTSETAADQSPPSWHGDGANPISEQTLKVLQNPFYTKPTVVTTADGRKLVAFRTGYHPKLKPRLVAQRLRNCRTYLGTKREIPGSVFKVNMVCQFVAGMPLEEALLQLTYLKKSRAPIVRKVLERTANLADIRHGIQRSALEVAECFATRATPIKDIKIMGRGHFGRVHHRKSHIRVVLREIDFQLKIYQARTIPHKKYWFTLQQRAEREAAIKTAEREEEERLERENAKKTQLLQSKK